VKLVRFETPKPRPQHGKPPFEVDILTTSRDGRVGGAPLNPHSTAGTWSAQEMGKKASQFAMAPRKYSKKLLVSGMPWAWAPSSIIPGVGVMAKRSQGLLNAGGSFPRARGRGRSRGSSAGCGSRAGGGVFFSRLQGGALGFGRPRACLGATRAAPPAPRARCSGQPRSK
jgi:hypothetical protein